MATDVQIALQPQAGQDPEAALAAAAVRLARTTLAALAQQMGQSLAGKVLAPGNLAPGFTQIATGSEVLTFRLSTPLPAGTSVRIDVTPHPEARTPLISIQPEGRGPASAGPAPVAPVRATPTPPAPHQPQATVPAPAPPVPSASPSLPTLAPQAAYPAPAAALPTPVPSVPAAISPAPQAAPAPLNVVPAASQPPAVQPAAPASPMVPPSAAPIPPLPSAPVATAAPSPTATATPSTPPVPLAVSPAPAPTASSGAGTPLPTTVLSQTAATPVQSPATSAIAPTPPAATSAPPTNFNPTPAPAFAPPQQASPLAAVPTVAPAAATAAPAASPVTSTPLPAAPVTAPPPQAMLQRLTQALAAVPQAAASVPAVAPTPAIAAATAQAAGLQQSVAPLLEALAVQLPRLPTPVAEAAARVLANRVSLDRGAPSGEALKAAVLKSGTLLAPPARAGEPPDLRAALTQLKGALLGFLGGEVEAIAPVARRPPPPARGATPRAFVPDLPPPSVSEGKEAARSLLGQTDGALARLKLLQLTSHGNDAARPGAATPAPAEWNLELPLLLGRELAMAQIQIARDGKQQAEARERGWRLRFALKFSVLGEVGAQIAMVGKRTTVALWADETLTAEMLEEMLPELAPALAERGLELASLTVRRGAPRDEARPMGQLMDSRR